MLKVKITLTRILNKSFIKLENKKMNKKIIINKQNLNLIFVIICMLNIANIANFERIKNKMNKKLKISKTKFF